ncbi:hypothetical protein [Arthrobacter sp. A5]|uniref:hypothetical protein n=1 Tax=Arthrobacter sp. A5 TaxID=576926 RepID=UPI003DAA0889
MGFLEDAKRKVKDALNLGTEGPAVEGNDESRESDPHDTSTPSSLERSGAEAEGGALPSRNNNDVGKNNENVVEYRDDVSTGFGPGRERQASPAGGGAGVEPLLGPADPTRSATPTATGRTMEAENADRHGD